MYTVNFSVTFGHGSCETFPNENVSDLKWFLEDIIGAYKISSILIKDNDGKIIVRENKNIEKFIREFCKKIEYIER